MYRHSREAGIQTERVMPCFSRFPRWIASFNLAKVVSRPPGGCVRSALEPCYVSRCQSAIADATARRSVAYL